MEVHVHFCERKEKLEGSFIRPKADFYIFYVIRAEKGRRLFCNNLSGGERKERIIVADWETKAEEKGVWSLSQLGFFFPSRGIFLQCALARGDASCVAMTTFRKVELKWKVDIETKVKLKTFLFCALFLLV